MYGHRDIRSRVFLHVLDILNQESIENLKHRLLSEYGGNYICFIKSLLIIRSTEFPKYLNVTYNISGLDILINNAARIYFPDSKEPYKKQARDTITTNYYGNKWVSIL